MRTRASDRHVPGGGNDDPDGGDHQSRPAKRQGFSHEPAEESPKTAQERVARPRKPPSTNKRASISNLRNYPSIRHPVAIGIWLIQKVEQARKERMLIAPKKGPRIGLTQTRCFPEEDMSSSTGQLMLDEARLQSQRDRKSKQRLENWAKSMRAQDAWWSGADGCRQGK